MISKNVKKAILWSIAPGVVIIVVDLLSGIQDTFLILILIILFPVFLIIGVYVLCLLWDIYKKTQAKTKSYDSVLILSSIIGFYFLLFPIIMAIFKPIEMDYYFYRNQDELEQIANHILNSKWTIKEANTYMERRMFDITVFDCEPQSKTVLYIIGGMLDGYGIAYSKTGKKYNSDRLRTWNTIRTNWYDWSIE